MNCKAKWAILTGTFLFLIGMTGCGQPLHQVKGKVTYEGKPLQGGGSITFVPTGTQRMAGGDIAPDGTYTLSSIKPGDGAMIGEFRVAITQTTDQEPEQTPDGQKPKAAPTPVPVADRIPLIYGDHQNSPLTAKVEAKSPNEIDFVLKKQ